MSREANFALGHWYRTRWLKREMDQYVKLVKKLVTSNSPYMRKIAFYLIRHSTLTDRQESVHVDSIFAPLLREIYLDPRLKLPEGLFHANLLDFWQLKKTREQRFHRR